MLIAANHRLYCESSPPTGCQDFLARPCPKFMLWECNKSSPALNPSFEGQKRHHAGDSGIVQGVLSYPEWMSDSLQFGMMFWNYQLGYNWELFIAPLRVIYQATSVQCRYESGFRAESCCGLSWSLQSSTLNRFNFQSKMPKDNLLLVTANHVLDNYSYPFLSVSYQKITTHVTTSSCKAEQVPAPPKVQGIVVVWVCPTLPCNSLL